MPTFCFVRADYDSSTSTHARVFVEMEIEGTRKAAWGEHKDKFEASLCTAIVHAVFKLTGLRPETRGWTGTIGGGREKCTAEVRLAVRKKGKIIVGSAEHADPFQAEVAAYVDALNQL